MYIMSAKEKRILGVNYSKKIVSYPDFLNIGDEAEECVEELKPEISLEILISKYGKLPNYGYRPTDFEHLGGLHWKLLFKIFHRSGMGGDACAAVEAVANGEDGFEAWKEPIDGALPMGETIIEQGQEITQIGGEIEQINGAIDGINSGLGSIAGEINEINDKLDDLIENP